MYIITLVFKHLFECYNSIFIYAQIRTCIQLRPPDVDCSSNGVTDCKLLKEAVATRRYPPTIECKDELKRTGRPVWLCPECVTGSSCRDKIIIHV